MLLLFFNKKFDSKVWKEEPEKRKYFLNDILKHNSPVGKTKEEIENLFGTDNNFIDNNRWSYFVFKSFWHKKRRHVLALYFENNSVARIEIEYRVKKKLKPFGS